VRFDMSGNVGWNIRPATIIKYGRDKINRALQDSLKRVGADMLLEISNRIAQSKNADNVPFEPYENSTIIEKRKKGHSVVVNLQDTSAMVNSIIIDAKDLNSLILRIGVMGVDKNGESNSVKARKLHKHKNYSFLKWTPSYKNFATGKAIMYFYRFLRRR